MMNERGKSDRPIVPGKSLNKAGQPAAEEMEGRGLTKGNPQQQNASRTPSKITTYAACGCSVTLRPRLSSLFTRCRLSLSS